MDADDFESVLHDLDLIVSRDALSALGGDRPTRLEVRTRTGRFTANCVFVPALAASSVPDVLTNAPGADLIFTRRLTADVAGAVREYGVDAVGADGNVTIRRDLVHIEVRGQRARPGSRADAGRAHRGSGSDPVATNLYSPRRAQVVFAVLTWPRLLGAPLRVVARAAGVSVGLTQDTFRLLTDLGHITDRGGPIERGPELVDGWLRAYPTGLGSTLALAAFHANHPDQALMDVEGLVSGEAAAPDLIKGTTVTMYVTEVRRDWIVRHRWRTDREPNVFLRRRFWSPPHPRDVERDLAGDEGRPQRAPLLIVRGDLRASREPRQRQVEQELGAFGAEA